MPPGKAIIINKLLFDVFLTYDRQVDVREDFPEL